MKGGLGKTPGEKKVLPVQKEVININSTKLHKGQLEIFNLIKQTKELNKLTYYTICSPRGFGKSLLLENLILYFALNNPNISCMYIAPTIKQIEPLYDDILVKLNAIGAIRKINSQSKYVNLINGTDIYFRSIQISENIRGAHVEYLFLDEAAMYDDNVFYRDIRPVLQPTGKVCILTSTPRGKNYFYNLFNLQEPGYYSYRGTNELNPFTNWDEIKNAEKQLPQKIFQQEYQSVFIEDGGEVFSNILNCSTIKNWQAPIKDKKYYAGIDVGRADDYTVLTIMDQDYNVIFIHRVRQKDWQTIINEVCQYINLYKCRSILVESNNAGDLFYEMMRKQARNIEPFWTGTNKNEIIENLIVLFENGTIHIPTKEFYPELTSELELYSYEWNKKSRTISYNARTGHDDTVMSLAIACNCVKNNKLKGSYNISVI